MVKKIQHRSPKGIGHVTIARKVCSDTLYGGAMAVGSPQPIDVSGGRDPICELATTPTHFSKRSTLHGSRQALKTPVTPVAQVTPPSVTRASLHPNDLIDRVIMAKTPVKKPRTQPVQQKPPQLSKAEGARRLGAMLHFSS